MNWKIGAAAAVVGVVAFAGTPANAESAIVELVGPDGQAVGCQAWLEDYGPVMVCDQAWLGGKVAQKTGNELIFGTALRRIQPNEIVGQYVPCLEGRVVFKVRSDRTLPAEGKAVVSCP